MKRTFNFPLLRTIFVVSALCLSRLASAGVTELDNAALESMLDDDVIVIDVRRIDEWESTGLVNGSHPITFFDARGRYDVADWLSQVDNISDDNEKEKKIVLICARGVRSAKIASLLDKRLGFKNIYNVSDGINHWIKKGKPVEKYQP